MQLRISMETQAKLKIQEMITNGELELVSSFAIAYEQTKSPFVERQTSVLNFIKDNAVIIVDSDKIDKIKELAEPIMETGVKRLDAYHIACALYAECDYMISVDDRLLKYKTDAIKLMNPIDFVKEMEGEGDV